MLEACADGNALLTSHEFRFPIPRPADGDNVACSIRRHVKDRHHSVAGATALVGEALSSLRSSFKIFRAKPKLLSGDLIVFPIVVRGDCAVHSHHAKAVFFRQIKHL